MTYLLVSVNCFNMLYPNCRHTICPTNDKETLEHKVPHRPLWYICTIPEEEELKSWTDPSQVGKSISQADLLPTSTFFKSWPKSQMSL